MATKAQRQAGRELFPTIEEAKGAASHCSPVAKQDSTEEFFGQSHDQVQSDRDEIFKEAAISG